MSGGSNRLAKQPSFNKMTEEIEFYEEELNDLIGEVTKDLDGLRRLTGQAKAEKLVYLENRQQRAKQVLQSYRVEMRDMPRDKAAPYDAKAREYHAQLKSMHAELTAAKQEHERQQVGVKTVDEMTTEEVLTEAGKVQDKSLGALGRMQQQIAQSREVGAATAVQLEGQTAQLRNIDADIMKVRSNLGRADLLLRAFMRKIMTDKIIMIFMLLIFIGIIVIVVWKIVDPKGLEDAGVDVPDQVVDPLSSSGRRLAAFRSLAAFGRAAPQSGSGSSIGAGGRFADR